MTIMNNAVHSYYAVTQLVEYIDLVTFSLQVRFGLVGRNTAAIQPRQASSSLKKNIHQIGNYIRLTVSRVNDGVDQMKNDPRPNAIHNCGADDPCVNRCLISLIAHNGEYFDLCRKVSPDSVSSKSVTGSSERASERVG